MPRYRCEALLRTIEGEPHFGSDRLVSMVVTAAGPHDAPDVARMFAEDTYDWGWGNIEVISVKPFPGDG